MKASAGSIRLSATDLSNHLACRHLTTLDLGVARGERPASTWCSPDAWVLQQRGIAHENAYIQHLQSLGLSVVNLRDVEDAEQALGLTLAAFRNGPDVIVQAALTDGQWFGRADVLRRVERPSKLGSWSFEVYDCKLARETKAATILQLSLYSELLSLAQGVPPASMYVVPPAEAFVPERHRVLDYDAYYRQVKSRLLAAIVTEEQSSKTYPEPTLLCEVCRWRPDCETQRRHDDHLSLVAGISKLQRKQLKIWNTTTVAELARFPLPIQQRPDYGSRDGYVRVREQARLQVVGREAQRPIHEILEITEEHGLSLLPEPSKGDMFFDLEGDPFVGLKGREYLFGIALQNEGAPTYECQWALTPADEKRGFEWFVDVVMARWAADPALHIYHFGAYEPSALKRLMGRHGTREEEIDRMLRAGLLVNLHTVLKRSVRASVESYSLKALEQFHGFVRRVPLEDAGSAMRQMQHALELGRTSDVGRSVEAVIEDYNADDCLSALSLRDWLEKERRQLEVAGHRFSRPAPSEGAAPEAVSERQQRATELIMQLRDGLPDDKEQRNEEQNGRWLLSNLIDWHRREAKVDWWEYFRLKDLTEEDLLEERSAISGLEMLQTIEVARNIPTDRYKFEKQETDIRRGDAVCERGDRIGTVVALDILARTVDIKKTKKMAGRHPKAIFVDARGPKNDVLADALYRLGSWVNKNGLDAHGAYRAGRDLLLRRAPRLRDGRPLQAHAVGSSVETARALVAELDQTVLPIQGPPGAGKTYTAARMICELVRLGRKIGITAVSHKVIRNLLDEVIKAAPEFGLHCLQSMQKVSEITDDDQAPGITLTTDNAEPLAALHGSTQVVAGTAWLWSREEYSEAVDVLFVDEAGQMSLANVLAVSQAARSLVLLGDPQQLEQPLKGSHPEGADVSALEHGLLGGKTITLDKGLFLEKTWRLHPELCRFTSGVFYESRLHSRDGLERQKIEGHAWLGEAGLWFVPEEHEGNQNSSQEEVERVADVVHSLLQPGVFWVDDRGLRTPLGMEHILIVAPYNAQVSDLAARLPGTRIGTVDKFQGQQAPIVIYSLTTSSPEEAPRGMEFLYSLNRLNVATSRAQSMVIVVASPRLLEPECHTPRQMQLANALCRYVELARTRLPVN